MGEVYFSGNNQKTVYAYGNQPGYIYEELKKTFPWVDKSAYFSISEPVYHEVLGENVITCCLPLPQSIVLVGERTALTARKFCMESKTSFLRSYELYDGERPAWLPSCANLFGIGINLEEFGRPFPGKANDFKDWYFGGDCAEIEAHFSLPMRRGAYDTWYAVTTIGDQVQRIKQYCYDEQSTFSDWEIGFITYCKRIGRNDKLVEPTQAE